MRCNICGNQLEDNACICDKCGSFCGGSVVSVCSRKEFFKSDKCSKGSKTLESIAWVLAVILAGILIFSALTTALKLPVLDNGDTKEEILSDFEEVIGAPTGIPVETLDETFGDDVEACREYFKKLAYTTVVISAATFLVTIAISAIFVYTKNSRWATWAFILCFLSNIIALGFGIALFIISRKWDKEYRRYCLNPSAFEETTRYNFS